MIVWGGMGSSYWNTGGRYNFGTDSWSATSTTNAPAARKYHTAVWTEAEMIVWGGTDSSSKLNTERPVQPGRKLSEGRHAFAVRAYDAALNVDPTPAIFNWTIDFTLAHNFSELSCGRSHQLNYCNLCIQLQ